MTFITIPSQVKNLYPKVKHRLFSWITKYQLTVKQVDAIATKLDIFGVFVVTQAFLNITDHVLLSIAIVTFSLICCAILWTIAFILKGYENA